MKTLSVYALNDYKIQVTFSDSLTGVVDLSDLVQSGIFCVLKDKTLFDKVYVSGSAIAWSEDLEIDARRIYTDILQNSTQIFTGIE